MKYHSTRAGTAPKSFEDVLMEGLAEDGGLYLPDLWPQLDLKTLESLPYHELAARVMAPFMPDIDPLDITRDCYINEFEHKEVAPLKDLGNGLHVMELFHGPTLAFKDYALQMLGRLFDTVLSRQDKHITIIGATSGDTGSAAIEACKGRDNIDIFILHPHNRTSDVQRRQMTTIIADNVHNIALKGSFDDCQDIVKAMFNDKDMRKKHNLSAINSINWARICAQIVYYFHAGLKLGAAQGKKVSFAVPTGNFGNVFAAYCAKQMGLPIQKLIIGTNRNDILTRFFETGEMKLESVTPSLSPSMDIQISSNFERFMADFAPNNVTQYMQEFKQNGYFKVTDSEFLAAKELFTAHRCDDTQTMQTIKDIHTQHDYLIDPHTAVGVHAALDYKSTYADDTPIVALACAHPAKFPDAVKEATGMHPKLPDNLNDLFDREEKLHVLENDLSTIAEFIAQKTT